MITLTSLVILFKSKNKVERKEGTQPENRMQCYELVPIVNAFGKAIYKDMALFVCIIFAILAYIETTLY
jgi:hypothetical protein